MVISAAKIFFSLRKLRVLAAFSELAMQEQAKL